MAVYTSGDAIATAKISEKGWIVIPQKIRKRYGLRKGDRVHIIDYGGVVGIVPFSKDPVSKGFGMFKSGPSLTKGLLENRRWELEREERDLPPPKSR